MIAQIDDLVNSLGNGKVLRFTSGEYLFKLDPYTENPVVKPQDLGLTWYEDGRLQVGAVFNGGAELIHDKIILTPRCHKAYRRAKISETLGVDRASFDDYVSEVWPLVSDDGAHFTRLGDTVIRGDGSDHKDFIYGIEDIRIIRYGYEYLLVGCGKIKPPFKEKDADRIAIYSTKNFSEITYHGLVDSFDSRNAVPFPEPIAGKVYMLFRFYPNTHVDYLEDGVNQLLNPSQYRESWNRVYERRRKTVLLQAGMHFHEQEKLGPGPPPIRTEKGWLLIYHAVGKISEQVCRMYGLSQKIDRGYSISAVIVDNEEPTKVLCRTRYPLYIPSAPWELYGNEQYPVDVSAVVFPVGAVVWKDKLLLYCGAGDKYVILLSCSLRSLVEYLWTNCRLND